MTQGNEDAGKLAKRAGGQAKNAGKNAGRAVRAVADDAAENVADEARETADKLEDAVDDAVDAARKINVGVLGRMSSDTGVGFLALSVSIYAGVIAYTKFRQAASGRSQVIS